MYRSATTHSEKPNRRNFRVRNSHGQRDHVTMTISDAAFYAVRFCSYAIRRTQYDRPSWSQLYASRSYNYTRLISCNK